MKLGLALFAIGIVWGNCVAAQVPAPPWPAVAPSGPYNAPSEPGDKPEAAPSACQLRLTPDRAVIQPMGDMRGPHGCGAQDVVSLERRVIAPHVDVVQPQRALRAAAEDVRPTRVIKRQHRPRLRPGRDHQVRLRAARTQPL